MRDSSRWTALRVGQHRLRYSVTGHGRAIVLPKKDLHPYWPATALADRYRVVQVEPIGFGRSDRPESYPPVSVPAQILAVCDAEAVEQFAVWGFSQGGAMAWAAAQATERVRAVVCGGFNALRPPSSAWIARMNRERRVPVGSRAFWNDFTRFDWHHEIKGLDVPALVYAGTRDKQRPNHRDQRIFEAIGVEVVSFDGLNHAQCGLGNSPSPATDIVTEWLQRNGWVASSRRRV